MPRKRRWRSLCRLCERRWQGTRCFLSPPQAGSENRSGHFFGSRSEENVARYRCARRSRRSRRRAGRELVFFSAHFAVSVASLHCGGGRLPIADARRSLILVPFAPEYRAIAFFIAF